MLSLPTFALCFTLDATPSPPLESAILAPGAATRAFVSRTLGSHMVLQAAPQQATVWGSTNPGARVTTSFDEQNFTATADVNGTWRQRLPPTPASSQPHVLSFHSTSGEAATLEDVVFGEVRPARRDKHTASGTVVVHPQLAHRKRGSVSTPSWRVGSGFSIMLVGDDSTSIALPFQYVRI